MNVRRLERESSTTINTRMTLRLDNIAGDIVISVTAAVEDDVLTPTLCDVNDAIKQFTNNKTTETDYIGAEHIWIDSENMATYLHRLIVRIWDSESFQKSFIVDNG